MTFARFFTEGALHTPTIVEPACEDTFVPSKVCRPLAHIHGFALKCKQAVTSPVVGLLLHGGPSAVIWGVVFIVIEAFQRVLRRGASHVFEECRKTVAPFVANSNPTRAISGMTWVLWIIASAHHTPPSVVFAWLLGPAHRVALRLRRRLALLRANTPTRSRLAPFQFASSSHFCAAALAAAKPLRPTLRRCSSVANNHQPTVSIPSQILISHNVSFRAVVS